VCDFVSWLEDEKGNIYFATSNLLQTKEAKQLVKEMYDNNFYHEDIKGHGFLKAYWPELKNPKQCECTDLSSPKNFPAEIIKQIKLGNMRFCLPKEPGQLLLKKASADYQAKCNPLDADYQAKCNPLDADYQAERDALYADWQAKCNPLYANWQAKCEPLYADYQAKCKPLYADWQAKCVELFWIIFDNPKNRKKEWRR